SVATLSLARTCVALMRRKASSCSSATTARAPTGTATTPSSGRLRSHGRTGTSAARRGVGRGRPPSMVVTAYQHETKHPQIHPGVTRMRQPGQRVRGAQPDKTDDGRPGHEHGEGHFEAVPPTVAPDTHPDDHRPGHEQR